MDFIRMDLQFLEAQVGFLDGNVFNYLKISGDKR